MPHPMRFSLFLAMAAWVVLLSACSNTSQNMIEPQPFAFAPYAQNEQALRMMGQRINTAGTRSAIDQLLIHEGGASAEMAPAGHTFYIFRSKETEGRRAPPWTVYVNAGYADNGDLQSLRYGVGYDRGFPSGPDLPPRTFDIFAWEAHGAGSGYGIYILQQQFNRIFPAGSSCQSADLYFSGIPEMGKSVIGHKATYAAKSGLLKVKRACAVSVTCTDTKTLDAPPAVHCGLLHY